uniref:Uncharacterized protein n=1 Tax=Rhizophora mucronata TaxID=61149 RepID=A0A2P2P6R8_RHIMU
MLSSEMAQTVLKPPNHKIYQFLQIEPTILNTHSHQLI